MKLFFNWIVSIVAITIMAYFYGFYSSFSELIETFDFGTLLFILIASAMPALLSWLATFMLEMMILKETKFEKWKFLIISSLISITLCILIIRNLSLKLTEI